MLSSSKHEKSFFSNLLAQRPVGLADEARTEAGFVGRPAAGDTAAEDRGAEHRSFQPRLPVDVAAGHPRHLSRGVEAGDWIEKPVEHAAAEIGFDAAEIFPRERKKLDGVKGRRVEFLRRSEERRVGKECRL